MTLSHLQCVPVLDPLVLRCPLLLLTPLARRDFSIRAPPVLSRLPNHCPRLQRLPERNQSLTQTCLLGSISVRLLRFQLVVCLPKRVQW